MIDPRNVPCCHDSDSFTSGTTLPRRPPNRIAEIGTPAGFSHCGEITGHWRAGVVKRAFGCEDVRPLAGVHGRRSQSVSRGGGGSDIPSHHASPSGVSAQFVKIEFDWQVRIALGLVVNPVPGATPKKPASGLIAWSRPSDPNFIQAMSSPTVSIRQPGSVGFIMARLVFPQADGNAAAMYTVFASGLVRPKISMCSASQPSS